MPTKSPVSSTAKPKKKSRFAFIGETISDLKKVVWPSKQETLRLTVLVLIVCVIIGAFLGAIDYGFTQFVSNVLLGGG